VAGHIYQHGIVEDGLPCASANTKIPINLHIGAVVWLGIGGACDPTRQPASYEQNLNLTSLKFDAKCFYSIIG